MARCTIGDPSLTLDKGSFTALRDRPAAATDSYVHIVTCLGLTFDLRPRYPI
jgi:hypothetical protein